MGMSSDDLWLTVDEIETQDGWVINEVWFTYHNGNTKQESPVLDASGFTTLRAGAIQGGSSWAQAASGQLGSWWSSRTSAQKDSVKRHTLRYNPSAA